MSSVRDLNPRYPQQTILLSTLLRRSEKALLLAVASVYSFDREQRCAFWQQHWELARRQLNISPEKAHRAWLRLVSLHIVVYEPAPFAPYWWISPNAIVHAEPLEDTYES